MQLKIPDSRFQYQTIQKASAKLIDSFVIFYIKKNNNCLVYKYVPIYIF